MDKVQVAITENARQWGTQLTQMMDTSTGDRNILLWLQESDLFILFFWNKENLIFFFPDDVTVVATAIPLLLVAATVLILSILSRNLWVLGNLFF